MSAHATARSPNFPIVSIEYFFTRSHDSYQLHQRIAPSGLLNVLKTVLLIIFLLYFIIMLMGCLSDETKNGTNDSDKKH